MKTYREYDALLADMERARERPESEVVLALRRDLVAAEAECQLLMRQQEVLEGAAEEKQDKLARETHFREAMESERDTERKKLMACLEELEQEKASRAKAERERELAMKAKLASERDREADAREREERTERERQSGKAERIRLQQEITAARAQIEDLTAVLAAVSTSPAEPALASPLEAVLSTSEGVAEDQPFKSGTNHLRPLTAFELVTELFQAPEDTRFERFEVPLPLVPPLCLDDLATETKRKQEKEGLSRGSLGMTLEGLVVSDLVAGGPAALCGQICQGDELIEANGQRLDMENLQALLSGNDGSMVDLLVRRGGAVTLHSIPLAPIHFHVVLRRTDPSRFSPNFAPLASSTTASVYPPGSHPSTPRGRGGAWATPRGTSCGGATASWSTPRAARRVLCPLCGTSCNVPASARGSRGRTPRGKNHLCGICGHDLPM